MDQKYKANSEKLLQLLKGKLGSEILNAEQSLGDVVIQVAPDKFPDMVKILKLDKDFNFDLFINVTAIDWLDQRDYRFEVVYHLMSIKHLYRLRIKVSLSESAPQIQSVVQLWPGANFMEREVWDMFGIKFVNHPDLRRILMYDEFVGHPLRKDYPLQGKQPRIPLRAPEVENTARNMLRPDLVQIKKRNRASGAVEGNPRD